MNERIPAIGSDVHFVQPGNPHHVAAKITAIAEGKTPDGQLIEVALLTVFLTNGLLFGVQSIQDEIGKAAGTYHFPEPATRIRLANGIP